MYVFPSPIPLSVVHNESQQVCPGGGVICYTGVITHCKTTGPSTDSISYSVMLDTTDRFTRSDHQVGHEHGDIVTLHQTLRSRITSYVVLSHEQENCLSSEKTQIPLYGFTENREKEIQESPKNS